MANEKRLIYANEVYENARHHWDFHRSIADMTSLEEVIEDCPTVDAVEVIFCDECTKSGYCIIEEQLVTARAKYRYCGLGERRDGE